MIVSNTCTYCRIHLEGGYWWHWRGTYIEKDLSRIDISEGAKIIVWYYLKKCISRFLNIRYGFLQNIILNLGMSICVKGCPDLCLSQKQGRLFTTESHLNPNFVGLTWGKVNLDMTFCVSY